ncbi:hypothetical protein BX616_002208 [Lobosporangium transversale]|nr:hypothetical protein BX616_002208 [Lobosporangium transversale]
MLLRYETAYFDVFLQPVTRPATASLLALLFGEFFILPKKNRGDLTFVFGALSVADLLYDVFVFATSCHVMKISYNCGQSGHISRDCSGERKERACYKCNEVGHISRDCPSTSSNDNGPECYKCGKSGHISRNCPSEGGFQSSSRSNNYNSNQSKTCFTCGGYGHMSRDCTQGAKCYNCGNSGHISRECPEERKEKACYKCGETGHISRDCPQQA